MGDKMTCQDCIHFRDIDGGECLFACGGVPADCEVNVVCEDKFEPTHESVGNALDALDS